MKQTSIARLASLACLALAAALAQATMAAQETHIVIEGASGGRIFDGLGAASAGASSRLLIDYPEPQRSQILDYLFKPGYGAALQRLKVEIGADVNSTDGSEPSHMRSPSDHDSLRGYEWWLMAEAHKRNPNIVLEILPWGAPGWVGNGTLYTEKMAAYVADFIRTAHKDYGLDIAYTGIWNETVYETSYIDALARALKGAGLATKIVCCDEYPSEGQWKIADEMRHNPALAEEVAAIGVHYPIADGRITTTEAARQSGKPLWSSEDQPNSGGGPFISRDWPVGGRILAHLYNRNYIEGAMTATEIWSPVTSYYDNLAAPNSGLMYANTPWSGNYKVQGTIWATAHTTQFAQPGWQYLDLSSGNLPGGSFVTLRAPDKKNWSMVMETIGAKTPTRISFRIAGGLDAGLLHLWETSDTHTFEHVADLRPEDGSFAFTFEPNALYTLTTTIGQGRGSAQPPAPSAFPFPYRDDFELQRSNHLPLYLSDQDGAFELAPCQGRTGQCLEQRITQKPIPWLVLPDPYTMAGDSNRPDYTLSADVRFISDAAAPQAAATLMGRIDSADVFADRNGLCPSGYVLRIHSDGAWELISTGVRKPELPLASGKLALDPSQWHHAELSFAGTRIEASFDGKSIATVRDGSHTNGMFALGSGWNRVQFDNLLVGEPRR
jgi:hypothetical protein